MEKNNSKPLVSVVVGVYNSSKYILETLESIKAQTYENIELIVTDDCSPDNTVEICREWINANKERFVNVFLVTSKVNTGSSFNANRGLKKATGEWVKMFAGDDLLMKDSIEKYVNFVNDDIHICCANFIEFSGNLEDHNFVNRKIPLSKVAFGNNASAKRQYNILKRQLIGSGTTFFARLELLKKVGFYDERFPLMDDYPLFIRISSAGYKIYLMNDNTIYYRNHSNSISHSSNVSSFLSNAEIRCSIEYNYLYKYEHLNWLWRKFLRASISMNKMIVKYGNNRKIPACCFFYYLRQTTDPFIWYSRCLNLTDRILKKFC